MSLFNHQSQAYSTFRPTYPEELYQFIYGHLRNRSVAWDCGTGNGQVARYLAKGFARVYATDISQQQLDRAFRAENIIYSLCPAERTSFEENQFDLVTVGQAIHWFDLPAFYKEVKRTCKPGALLAVWGYSMLAIEPGIDKMLLDFYHNTVGPYWDDARKLVENHYRDLPFPFEVIPSPEFFIRVSWTADQFAGYLSSWSATQRYIEANHHDPVAPFREQLQSLWKPGEHKLATFPVFMKLGRVFPG